MDAREVVVFLQNIGQVLQARDVGCGLLELVDERRPEYVEIDMTYPRSNLQRIEYAECEIYLLYESPHDGKSDDPDTLQGFDA
jgi:hypothetical protein